MSEAQEQVEREHRRMIVAQRYLKGEYQSVIARDLGITQQQVSKDLQIVRAMWLKAAIRDFDDLKAQELAKIDEVEREAWLAWERSKRDKEVHLTEQIDGEGAPIVTKLPNGTEVISRVKRKARVMRKGQVGTPAYLQIVLECNKRRCAILGLDAPQKFNIEIDWDNLTEEQESRLAAGEDPLKVLSA